MDQLLNSSSNGPLITIISYMNIYDMCHIMSLVNRSFYNAYQYALLRIEKGYSQKEYNSMFNRQKGISERLLWDIINRSGKIDYRIKVKNEKELYMIEMDILSFCCYKKYERCGKRIIEVGKIEIKNKHMFISCNNGCIEIVKWLVEVAKFDPSEQENYPLLCASSNGHMNIVKYLLDDERVIKTDPTIRNILIHCSNAGHLEILKLLVEKFKIREVNEFALISAVENKKLDIVKFLLNDVKCDVTVKNHLAFKTSCQNGSYEIAKLLIEYVESVDSLEFSLRWSSKEGYLKIVRLIFSHKLSEQISEETKNLALQKAVVNSRIDVIKILLNKIKDEKTIETDIIEMACMESSLDTVKLLMGDEKVNKVMEKEFIDYSILSHEFYNIEVSKYFLEKDKELYQIKMKNKK